MSISAEAKSEIDGIYSAKEKEQYELHQKGEESLSRRNEFLEGFNRFCEEVVIPKMEEIGSYIKKEHNVGYTIKPEKALVSEMGKELIRVVVMEILSSPRNRPSISVKADAGSNEVLLTEMHAGAWSSTPTTFSLKDITGDIVEKHILSVLRV